VKLCCTDNLEYTAAAVSICGRDSWGNGIILLAVIKKIHRKRVIIWRCCIQLGFCSQWEWLVLWWRNLTGTERPSKALVNSAVASCPKWRRGDA